MWRDNVLLMVIDNTLTQLGGFLDAWAGDVASVRSVTVSDDAGLGVSEHITAEVTLEIPIVASGGGGDRLVNCRPSVDGENIGLECETGLSIPEGISAETVSIDPVDATLHTDGTATMSVRLELCTADWAEDSLAGTHQPESDRRSDARDGESESLRRGAVEPSREREEDSTSSQDVPPFRNPELLREVYESHDTFAEMADALEMDVTGETVRRYMIDHDIHQTNSYRSDAQSTTPAGTDSDDSQEVAIPSDGLGLPEGVTVEELIETVTRSNTIYEVKMDLDLEHMEAHTMLEELQMVDLVLGRLSGGTSNDTTREDVVERLRMVSQATPHS